MSSRHNGDTLEIIIKDSSNRKIEQFKANLSDKKLCKKILSIIEHKYNLVSDQKPNDKEEVEEHDWLSMDNNFFN